jgi:hypothetical protein
MTQKGERKWKKGAGTGGCHVKPPLTWRPAVILSQPCLAQPPASAPQDGLHRRQTHSYCTFLATVCGSCAAVVLYSNSF